MVWMCYFAMKLKNASQFVIFDFYFRMWSMRRPNCLFSSRCVRSTLQQQNTNINRTSNVNFGTVRNIKIAQSAKQVDASSV